MLSKMITKHGTLLFRTVVMKLHSTCSSAAGSSLRFIHSSSLGNAVNKIQHCLQKNYCSTSQYFPMKQPCRLFRNNKFTKKSEEKFQTKDKVPEEYELIYKAPNNSYIFLAQSVALICCFVVIITFVYKLFNGTLTTIYPFKLDGKASEVYGEIGSEPLEIWMYIITFVMLNATILRVARMYPLRIYCHKNADAYICVMNGLLPSLPYKINYCSADVTRSKLLLGKIIPWSETIFNIGSKRVLFMDIYFRTLYDFNLMTNEKEKS